MQSELLLRSATAAERTIQKAQAVHSTTVKADGALQMLTRQCCSCCLKHCRWCRCKRRVPTTVVAPFS